MNVGCLEHGQVVYTREVSFGRGKGSLRIKTKRPIICLVLGAVPDTKDIKIDETLLEQLIIEKLGLIKLDDIAECLGENAIPKLEKFLQAKYQTESQE